MTTKLRIIAGTLLLILALAACSPQTGLPPTRDPNSPVGSEDTPEPTKEPLTIELEKGERAMVEEVDILLLESFPLQVMASIRGQLPDGCTEIDEALVERPDDTTFLVRLITARPKDAMCTQALVPFDTNVPLDVYGLPAGTYTVKVYDLTASFTFEQDNILK